MLQIDFLRIQPAAAQYGSTWSWHLRPCTNIDSYDRLMIIGVSTYGVDYNTVNVRREDQKLYLIQRSPTPAKSLVFVLIEVPASQVSIHTP